MDFDNALDLFQRTIATERSRPDVHAAMLKLAQPDTIGAVSTQIQQALARGERVWMTADQHLCHANVIRYCNRPYAVCQGAQEAPPESTMNPHNVSNGATMKLLVYSDLHLDLYPLKLQLDPNFLKTIDVVVLAGDITEGTKGLPWARETFPDKAIVYVDGNHEFYGQNWDKHGDAMRELAREHEIQYLEKDAVTIGGVRFLGCTLWTDFALHGADTKLEAMSTARQRMSDYKRIKISPQPELYWQRKHRLFPAMAARRHQESRQWLEEQLSQGDPQNTVVVTHHAPHLQSIPEDFAEHPLSPCYASNLDGLMGRASTWIHGHIHDSVDYRVRGTRVVSNPRGYKLRGGAVENSGFRVAFRADIGG